MIYIRAPFKSYIIIIGTLNVLIYRVKLGQLLIHNGVPTNSNNSKLAPLALAIKLFSPRDKNGLTNKLPS
jgi:hypothetical protein